MSRLLHAAATTVLAAGLAIAAGPCPSAHAAAPDDAADAAALRAELQELRDAVGQQGAQLTALQAQLDARDDAAKGYRVVTDFRAELAEAADLAVAEAMADAQAQQRDSAPILQLGELTDSLRLTGDLRVRYERRERTVKGVESTRDLWRQRLRLGGIWASDGWEIGVGLTTGGSSATSTNDTYSEDTPFETGDIRLDYAYAKHQWDAASLTVGQQKNPYVGSWLVWDADVRPVGITGQYAWNDFTATAGAYDVRHLGSDEAEAYLTAAQLAYAAKHDALSYKAALTWYGFSRATVQANTHGISPSPTVADADYSFQLGDLYAELGYKTGPWTLTGYGEFVHNFAANGDVSQVSGLGADNPPDSNANAWILGTKVKRDKLTLSYAYAHVEADSLYGALNDSTMALPFGGTDVEAHAFAVNYAITRYLSLGASAYLMQPLERTDREDGAVYAVDALWKF